MKHTFILLCSVVVAGLSSSCSTVQKTSKTTSIATSVLQSPTVGDLVVGTRKVEKTVLWSGNPFAARYTLNQRKHNLIAEVLKEQGADVLVEPRYVYYANGLFGRRELTVIGYPAHLKNFRTAREGDVQALAVAQGKQTVRLVSTRPEDKTTDVQKDDDVALVDSVMPAPKVKSVKKTTKKVVARSSRSKKKSSAKKRK